MKTHGVHFCCPRSSRKPRGVVSQRRCGSFQRSLNLETLEPRRLLSISTTPTAPRELFEFEHLDAAGIVYVDDDAANDPLPGDPTVSDPWEDGTQVHPFDAIQEAIDAARDDDTVIVLDGTYSGPGNRGIDFLGKAITVRSQNGPENCIVDGQDLYRGFRFYSGEGEDSVLQGLKITAGNVDRDGEWLERLGGGIACEQSSPTIADCELVGNRARAGGGISFWESDAVITGCTIRGNRAGDSGNFGGGIYCDSAAPTITDCRITDNEAGHGGAIASYNQSTPTIANCTIIGNLARGNGGGIFCYESAATVIDSTISGNVARNNGGGFYCDEISNATLINCAITGNRAEQTPGRAGGILSGWNSHVTVVNCTISGNRAVYGGGLYCEPSGTATVTNSIFWGDGPNEVYEQSPGNAVINSSCIRSGWPGSNIDADPLFLDADGPDDVVGTEDDDLRLLPGSPCIDAGDNAAVGPSVVVDLEGNPRFVDDPNTPDTGLGTPPLVDIGAYEFQGRTIYVDTDAAGSGDGSSWADAYNDLQDALSAAASIPAEIGQIRVAEGVYTPDQGAGQAPGDREATFQLQSGLVIAGGFAGVGGADPYARDLDAFETILSGDLNGDDTAFADPVDLVNDPTRAENSYHVVTYSEADVTAVLDGVTISSGYANGIANSYGAGMLGSHGSATLTDCTFRGNFAQQHGGGLNNYMGSPTLIDCAFSENYAADGGGGMGNESGSPTLVACTFDGNYALVGGGMSSAGGSPTLSDCTFTRNSGWGGGIASYTDMTVNNCLFSRNLGTGISTTDSSAAVTNCTFVGNHGGIFAYCEARSPTLTNCVFWDNGGEDEAAQISWDVGAPVVNYSCVQGWTGDLGGTGNLGADPQFADPAGGDYRLMPGSPCIDAGDDSAVPPELTTDLDGNPRINGTVDMGAYESVVFRPVYVDADAAGRADGSSWEHAFPNLQDALAAAEASPIIDEIRVAEGVYTPDKGAHQTPGDREATFQLLDRVTVMGGFAGFGEADPDARDIDAYQTILSGDLIGNDEPVADPSDERGWPGRNENSYHVVTSSGTRPTAVLDGFTITGGLCSNREYGAGVLNIEGSPTLLNCTVTLNRAEQGGGMYNGGDTPSNPTLINCTLSANYAGDCGGGMFNLRSNPTLVGCALVGNLVSDWGGGGMWNVLSSPTLTNCTITGNWASDGGSGIYNSSSNPILTNCIVWGNLDDQITAYGDSELVITYSDVEGDWDDTGNINADPLFVDADGPDDVFGTPDDDLRLRPRSPCIDAADNHALPPDTADLDGDGDTTEPLPWDFDGNPRRDDLLVVADTGSGTAPIVDMGAYEVQAIAGRHVFYNNSYFDTRTEADPHFDDDTAIAPDKTALLPGETASFENYTSYSRGINGIMVDVARLGDEVTAADFEFRVGNDDDPAGWQPVAGVPTVTARFGQGAAGSTRVSILFEDNAIQNQWLQVTVLANQHTALAEPDVFYFGNAAGESGNSTSDAKVNAYDMLVARDNQRGSLDPAPIDFDCDFDRNARVNAADMIIARNNTTHFLNALKLITVPTKRDAAAAVGKGTVPFLRSEDGDAGKGTVPFSLRENRDSPLAIDWLLQFDPAGAADGPFSGRRHDGPDPRSPATTAARPDFA